ncbi:MAG: hypothetical protein JNL58_29525 [Planctomyces sp.]|nr:hypothetical protein [Planctomyces sp.]
MTSNLFRVLLLTALSVTVHAGEVSSTRVGFGGFGRIGQSIPVSLSATGCPSGTTCILRTTSSDPLGNLCVADVGLGKADASGSITLQGVFRVGRMKGDVRLQVIDQASEEILAESMIAVDEATNELLTSSSADSSSSSDSSAEKNPSNRAPLLLVRQSCQTLLTVGTPAGVREAQDTMSRQSPGTTLFVAMSVPGVAELPEDSRAYDGIDYLLLTDDFSVSKSQTRAIREYVERGGHLIISAGAAVAPLRTSELGDWMVDRFQLQEGTGSARDLSAMQDFVRGAVQLQTNRRIVPVARVGSDQVRVIVSSLEGPIVARRSEGAGVMTFISVDLNQKPVSSWASLSMFYELLLFEQVTDTLTGNSEDRSIRISSSGMSDLGTQLQAVYDAVPPEARWSSWQIMALMVVYILVIGPLDYVLVVLLLKRAHLTWITFPLTVGIGCVAIWYFASHDNGSIVQRQLDIVDLSETPSEQSATVRSFMSLSADKTRRASVEAKPTELIPGSPVIRELSWYGRAEDVYGGMYRSGGAGLGRQSWHSEDSLIHGTPKLSQLPLLANGSMTVYSESGSRAPTGTLFESSLNAAPNGLLDGSFRVHLNVPITDWVVIYGSRMYDAPLESTQEDRTLMPGEEWSRSLDSVRISGLTNSLKGTRLVRRKQRDSNVLKGESSKQNTPYNEDGRDPLEIMLMVSLYDAAGGESYVKLRNDQMRVFDQTDSTRLNHALLLGRLDSAAMTYPVDGALIKPDQTDTIVRILLPVKRMTNANNAEAARPATLTPIPAAPTEQKSAPE